MSRSAYIGLGSNLGHPVRNVERALAELADWGPLHSSSLYRTEPLGDCSQRWYINAVACLETDLEPAQLFRRLQQVERKVGRPARAPHWAPRVLDLDLILVGNLLLETPTLKLPHVGFSQRRFVLEPLFELAPEVPDPRDGRTVRELLETLDDPLRVEKLGSPRTSARGVGSVCRESPGRRPGGPEV